MISFENVALRAKFLIEVWDDSLQQNCVKLIMSTELDLWGFARERYPP